MESFVNFIKEYWQFICAGILFILQLIILFIKRKKPEVMGDGVLDVVEHLVNEAEHLFGKFVGEDKLEYVVRGVQKIYPTATREAIVSRVEFLLTLPQKKGVK